MPRIVGAAIAIAATFVSFAARADETSPETRYEAAQKVLCPTQSCYDVGIGDAPEQVRALDEAWSATQDWTVAYLTAHPDSTAEKLKTALLNAHAPYQPTGGGQVYEPQRVAPEDLVQLEPGLYAASTGYGGSGNTFLIAGQNGQFRVVWDSRAISTDDLKTFPVLRSWQAASARDSCRSSVQDSLWDQCGPISGSIVKLPPDSQGRLRFYIYGGYAQLAGETVAGQISIWSLDGNRATALLAKSFVYDLEDVHVGFAHGLLTVRAKDEYQSYYSCGACLGRRTDWTIRIAPDGVTDLGVKPLYPELDTVDALFQRIEKRQDAGDLASPHAVSKLKDIMAPTWDETADPPKFDLDMIDYSSVRRANGRAVACMSIEAFDSGLAFTLEKRDAKDFITDVALRPSRKGGKC